MSKPCPRDASFLAVPPREALDGGPASPRAPGSFRMDAALTSAGPCPRFLDAVVGALGTPERKSGGEASGKAASPFLSTLRLRPGRAARTVAATTWLSGRSARQRGLGDEERSFLESLMSGLWASGAGPRVPPDGGVGEAGVEPGLGCRGLQNHLPNSSRSLPFPGSPRTWHGGSRHPWVRPRGGGRSRADPLGPCFQLPGSFPRPGPGEF